jgi:hypothetical protein
MRRPLLLFTAVLACLISALPAGAIIGGSADFTHPYVGLLDNGSEGCSGTLVAPRVLVTAAHCFAGASSLWGIDHGQPKIRVTFDQQGIFNTSRVLYYGAFYSDPNACLPCGNGSKRVADHDVAVVILDSPVAMSTYGRLPAPNVVDTLKKGAALDAVGYGVQSFIKPGQPDLNQVWTRFAANVTLLDNDRGANGDFIKITPAQCPGDSGGPVFPAGQNVVLAVMSYGDTRTCEKPGFDYRLDGQALGWIAQTVTAHT